MLEARALVVLLVAGEQSPANTGQASAFLAVETYRQATLPPHSLAQPPSVDAVVSFSLRLA
eukprot:scaffold107863_cov24-Phaeocystis_antarctica.AAC.1